MAMRFLQRAVAVWVLAAFGACYAFPVTIAINARAAKCCNRDGHGACCRKHAETTGSVFTAAAACAQNCRLPAGLTAHASPLVAASSAAIDGAVHSATLGPRDASPSGFASYFAFLYQRPPPYRF